MWLVLSMSCKCYSNKMLLLSNENTSALTGNIDAFCDIITEFLRTIRKIALYDRGLTVDLWEVFALRWLIDGINHLCSEYEFSQMLVYRFLSCCHKSQSGQRVETSIVFTHVSKQSYKQKAWRCVDQHVFILSLEYWLCIEEIKVSPVCHYTTTRTKFRILLAKMPILGLCEIEQPYLNYI